MKKRFLPIGVFSILICGLVVLFLISANENNNEQNIVTQAGGQSILGAKEYLALIRNNQHTGVLNPKDVIAARKQIEEKAMLKSGNDSKELNWVEMGPDNIGGRTRALLFDNKDPNANTLYAGSVTGGLFKSTNLGTSWTKINNSSGTANLNVSTMVQASNGTIFVGTGEGMSSENYTGTGDLGYEGGFVGRGVFKSDNNDNFTRVVGTNPEFNIDFAYVNKLKIDTKNNRLYAATQSSLKYATLPIENAESWSSDCKYRVDSAIINRMIQRDSIIVCDSFEIVEGELEIYGESSVEINYKQDDTTSTEITSTTYKAFEEYGNVYDIDISSDGWIITSFNGFIYVSESGDPTKFVKRSIYPVNDDYVRKDNINFVTNVIVQPQFGSDYESVNTYSDTEDWHTDYVYIDEAFNPISSYPSSLNTGRLSFAIAPSNQNIVYAMAAKSTAPLKNSLYNIYLSEDKGNTWRIIAPGGTNIVNILGYWYFTDDAQTFYYQGDYNNTLTVFPDDPYRLLAGGVNMWEGTKVQETGYFQWEEKSIGNATFLPNGIFNILYCHVDHHSYVFRPGYNNQFFAGTDGGIYSVSYDGFLYYFAAKNKNYNVTQYYSVDVSAYPYEVIGGTQDNGTQYIPGTGNTPMKGEDMWRPANLDPKYPEGTDGGAVAVSNIRVKIPGVEEIDPASFYSKSLLPQGGGLKVRMRRSETLGYDYSSSFFEDYDSPSSSSFITPMTLWECYTNENSRDSVQFKAKQDYNTGDAIIVRSHHNRHPIRYVLTEPLSNGDSIMVQDVISSKLFLAVADAVWMSLNSPRFNEITEWHIISDDIHNGVENTPSSLAYSADGNYLFVGTMEGQLYRISNIAMAYDSTLADVGSSSCIINTTQLYITEENSQVVTSISVDPKNSNNVLVTLGNYGNTEYIYYSTNALSGSPTFESKQGDLPKMPVYSSVLEMQSDNDLAIIGTEEGLWATDDITAANPTWYDASGSMGKVPVMALKQQTNTKTSFTISNLDPGTGAIVYEIYPEITNYGMIYAATHGRGIFRDESYSVVGIEDNSANGGSGENGKLVVYPNPATNQISVTFDLESTKSVQLNIYDLSGKLVLHSVENGLNNGTQSIKLNTEQLNRGTYLVKMVAGNEISTAKLIIIK